VNHKTFLAFALTLVGLLLAVPPFVDWIIRRIEGHGDWDE
jgi:hypothetical protein